MKYKPDNREPRVPASGQRPAFPRSGALPRRDDGGHLVTSKFERNLMVDWMAAVGAEPRFTFVPAYRLIVPFNAIPW